ncbi:MAG TPA: hypothetical protein VKB38_05705 [Terracidiphilus sp.]|nr:hypothetical protein [Terracidiphilus sp.]
MKRIAPLSLTALFVTCIGCGAVKGTQNPKTTSSSGEKGSSTVTFAIPIHSPGSQFTAGPQSSKARARAAAVKSRSQFVDSSANGDFQIYLDGAKILDANFTPQWNGDAPVQGPGPSAPESSTPDGGSISYTSNVTATEIDVTVNLTTVSEVAHTLGVVQVNGACLANASGTTDWCLGGSGAISDGFVGVNNGYVLAEGQTSFTLSPGSDNSGISLTLKGVLEAGYLCTDDACVNQTISKDENGAYKVIAYPVDENGSAVTSSTYSNGWWDIEELDNKGILTISTANASPFNAPNINASGWDEQPFTFTCNHTGDTTIGIRLLTSNAATGPVSGFKYNQANYPKPGDVLGAVGSDLFFGDKLPVHCQAYGSVTINVN